MSMARWFLLAPMGGGEINVICPTITPTLGGELLADPDLEATYTAGLCDSLTKSGLPNVVQSADAHSGAKAQQFQAAAQFNRIQYATTQTAGTWYQASIWGKRTAGATGDVLSAMYDGTEYRVFGYITAAAYTQFRFIFRGTVTAANRPWRLAHTDNPAAWDTVIVDDLSFRALDFASCLAYLGKLTRQTGVWSCTPTVADETQAGMAINYAGEGDLLLAYVNREDNKAYLIQCDGGTWSVLRSGDIAYGAGNVLAVTITGTTAKLLYNGVQVGADAAITASSLGRRVYGFNTYAGNEVGAVSTAKA